MPQVKGCRETVARFGMVRGGFPGFDAIQEIALLHWREFPVAFPPAEFLLAQDLLGTGRPAAVPALAPHPAVIANKLDVRRVILHEHLDAIGVAIAKLVVNSDIGLIFAAVRNIARPGDLHGAAAIHPGT